MAAVFDHIPNDDVFLSDSLVEQWQGRQVLSGPFTQNPNLLNPRKGRRPRRFALEITVVRIADQPLANSEAVVCIRPAPWVGAPVCRGAQAAAALGIADDGGFRHRFMRHPVASTEDEGLRGGPCAGLFRRPRLGCIAGIWTAGGAPRLGRHGRLPAPFRRPAVPCRGSMAAQPGRARGRALFTRDPAARSSYRHQFRGEQAGPAVSPRCGRVARPRPTDLQRD